MPLDWRRVGDLCRNPFFWDNGKCLFFSVAVTILQFVSDVSISQAWLRHHSTQYSMRKTVMPLDWRRVGDLCRNPFFWDNGKCLFFSVAVTILQFVSDVTVSRACHRHQSTRNWMRKTVMLSDGRRIENSCRDPFFWDNGKCLFFSVAVTIYNSSMISPFLKHCLGINRRRIR